MGKNRRGTSAACACAGRSSSESSHGSASATPAPRNKPRREMERPIALSHPLVIPHCPAATRTKRFGRNDSLDQAANARGLIRCQPCFEGALQVRFVAGGHDPAETVSEQLSGKAR